MNRRGFLAGAFAAAGAALLPSEPRRVYSFASPGWLRGNTLVLAIDQARREALARGHRVATVIGGQYTLSTEVDMTGVRLYSSVVECAPGALLAFDKYVSASELVGNVFLSKARPLSGLIRVT